MKILITLTLILTSSIFTGCATLTEDAMPPVSLSFSDGTEGDVVLTNKRKHRKICDNILRYT